MTLYCVSAAEIQVLSLQRESWGWCLGLQWADVSHRARPGVGLMAVAPQVMVYPRWRLVMLKLGVSHLSCIAHLLLMNAGCRVTFLLLNCVLLGLVGFVTSFSVRARRSEAKLVGFGRSDRLAVEMLSVPGDAKLGYQGQLPSGWHPCVSHWVFQLFYSFPPCQWHSSHAQS